MPSNLKTRTTVTSRSRTSAAIVAAATLAVTGLTAVSAMPASAAPRGAALASAAAAAPSNLQVARWGAGYLARQITANGGFVGSPAAPDVPDTAYAVLGLHAAGVGAQASDQAIAFLKTQVATGLTGSDGKDDPGRLGLTILAAVSAGQNPRQFGGTTPRNNLVTRLLATAHTSGADKGLFGTTAPTFDGAFRQGEALTALKAAGVAEATVASSLSWLAGQQCASGLWTSYRPDATAPCPAPDPVNFTGPDTNSSGLAMQGLAAYGERPRKSLALNAFRAIETSDGGFSFIAAPGQTSDPDSTAISIQGLLAYGAADSLPSFRRGGHSPYSALAAYQVGCAGPAAEQGGFQLFLGAGTANLFATVQSVPAMAHATFPLARSTPGPAVPSRPCSVANLRPSAAASTAAANAVAARRFAPAVLAGTAGACKGTTGVTVAVDFTAFTGGKVQVRCAPGKPATGIAALQQAGFTPAGTAAYGLAFVCRINSKPTTAQQACVTTPPVNAYWAYYKASHTADDVDVQHAGSVDVEAGCRVASRPGRSGTRPSRARPRPRSAPARASPDPGAGPAQVQRRSSAASAGRQQRGRPPRHRRPPRCGACGPATRRRPRPRRHRAPPPPPCRTRPRPW